MIKIKSPREISLMRQAGKVTAAARELAGNMVTAGVTTREIDKAVHDYIVSKGAIPTFLGYSGYPASICISVNDELIHGIPGKRRLKDGDVVCVDVGATLHGYVGDCAATFIVGQGDEEARRLAEVTKQSFFEGIRYARQGGRVSDISHAVQTYAESFGYGVVREYVGHGVGEKMHEDPEVPNYGAPGRGPRLVRGMTLAVEPMINAGTWRVDLDGWKCVTADGKNSAHYENTILITEGDPEILTLYRDGKEV